MRASLFLALDPPNGSKRWFLATQLNIRSNHQLVNVNFNQCRSFCPCSMAFYSLQKHQARKKHEKTMIQVGSTPSHALFWREISCAADSHATCSCSRQGNLPTFPIHKKKHMLHDGGMSGIRVPYGKVVGRRAGKQRNNIFQYFSCQFWVLLLGKRVPWTPGKWPATTNNEDKPTRFSWQETTKTLTISQWCLGVAAPKSVCPCLSKICLTLVFAGLRPN